MNLKTVWATVYKFLKRNWFVLFALAVYLFFTAYYMGPSITSCTTTTYGFGDNTAGPIWREQLPEPQGLLGAYTHQTNYPFGDNLYNPVGYSLVLQTALIKGSQAVAGPVCGYNLINAAGFIASALVMFGFVYALTRLRWVALFAGYAASFTPYYQMKVGGHPSYGYQALFIAIIWLFYRVAKNKKKTDAILLALVYLVSVYFDPYFTLFSSIVLAAIVSGWLIVNWRALKAILYRRKIHMEGNVEQVLARLLLAVSIIVIGLLPLATIYVTKGKQIDSTVAAARGNVVAEAQACSNYPQEYFIPFVLNPIFTRLVGTEKYQKTENVLKDNFSCGIGEDSVGLSLVMLSITAIGVVVLGWELLNNRRLRLSKTLFFEPKALVAGVFLLGLIGFMLGLPPTKYQGILPTLSYELLRVTPTWRTLARVYMLINISLVVLTAVVLAYFSNHFKKSRKVLVVLGCLVALGVFVEYQAFAPFSGNRLSTFDYRKDVPSAYVWLSSQKNIGVIAEYPLEREGGESDAGSYYLSMQSIHKKKLFNSALSNSPQESVRSGLKNLSDPQTMSTLRSFGVDAVTVHGVEADVLKKIPGVKILYTADQSAFNLLSHTPTVKYDNIVVIGLDNVPKAAYFLELAEGFARNTTIIDSAAKWEYEAIDGSTLLVKKISGGKKVVNNNTPQLVCFNAKMSVPEENTNLIAEVDGHEVNLGQISGLYKPYSVLAVHSVTLHPVNGHNMRVTTLGCAL